MLIRHGFDMAVVIEELIEPETDKRLTGRQHAAKNEQTSVGT